LDPPVGLNSGRYLSDASFWQVALQGQTAAPNKGIGDFEWFSDAGRVNRISISDALITIGGENKHHAPERPLFDPPSKCRDGLSLQLSALRV
jgi:hypothetical protein